MEIINKIALIINIIGGINYGLIGVFQFDLIAFICSGQETIIARIVYSIIALSAIWCISLLFSKNNTMIKE